jgi:hypothetical protein
VKTKTSRCIQKQVCISWEPISLGDERKTDQNIDGMLIPLLLYFFKHPLHAGRQIRRGKADQRLMLDTRGGGLVIYLDLYGEYPGNADQSSHDQSNPLKTSIP